MSTLLTNGTLIIERSALEGRQLLLENGRIHAILSAEEAVSADQVLDLNGMFVTPGLIDIHLHGSDGHDTMDATDEALAGMGQFLAACGVTSYLPTTISESGPAIQSALEAVRDFRGDAPGARPLGVHLEGPYLNPEHKGAQDARYLRDPEQQEYQRWFESAIVRLITLAPEREGADRLLQDGIRAGIRFAIGHSGAEYDRVVRAIELGVTQSTHTFNAMSGLHHRRPGTVGAVLTDDRVFAQVIADGVHLHPATIDLVIRCKGLDRTVLITDAIRAAGLEDGEYQLGAQTVQVIEGEARLPSGNLAGSTLRMDAAVRNVMRFADLTFPEAVHMATYTPALAMGWVAEKGTLEPGSDADIAVFDADYRVRLTIVGGEIAFDDR